jgi:hypothetical protein
MENIQKDGMSNPMSWSKTPGVVRIPVCKPEIWVPNVSWWGNMPSLHEQMEPPCAEYPCCSKQVLWDNLPEKPKIPPP